MRIVRSEADVVDADEVGEGLRVLLVERVDPDVPFEHRDGILLEELGLPRVEPLVAIEHGTHPGAAVLDRQEAQPREARRRPCPMIEPTTSAITRVSWFRNSTKAFLLEKKLYSLSVPSNQFT